MVWLVLLLLSFRRDIDDFSIISRTIGETSAFRRGALAVGAPRSGLAEMHRFQWETLVQSMNWPHRKARYARGAYGGHATRGAYGEPYVRRRVSSAAWLGTPRRVAGHACGVLCRKSTHSWRNGTVVRLTLFTLTKCFTF